MHIIHVAAEFSPIASVGGLGEVVHGLSAEQKKQGLHPLVLMPKHPCIDEKQLNNLVLLKKTENCSIYQAEYDNVPLILFASPLFLREKIYGYEDDPFRFSAFCHMAYQFLQNGHPIDILHLHDWHTAFLAPLFKKPRSFIKKICISIHNLAYQGIAPRKKLYAPLLQEMPWEKKVNPLKEGLRYADAIIAVSPTYAKEILTKKMGAGLDQFLIEHAHKVQGILNGIDQKSWDPAHDVHLFSSFSSQDPLEKILTARKTNKKMLLEKLDMSQKLAPLVANIGRLVDQKGPKLIAFGIKETLKLGGEFILLGSSPIKKIQKHFEKLQKKYRNNPNVHFHFEYDAPLSHQIYSACDFLLIPSVFEPCGLTQIIGFRYGAIPIARKTGGLCDTVFDQDDASIPEEKKTGYLFNKNSKKELAKTLKRVMDTWHNQPETISHLIQKNVALDYSWEKSAKAFLQLYRSL